MTILKGSIALKNSAPAVETVFIMTMMSNGDGQVNGISLELIRKKKRYESEMDGMRNNFPFAMLILSIWFPRKKQSYTTGCFYPQFLHNFHHHHQFLSISASDNEKVKDFWTPQIKLLSSVEPCVTPWFTNLLVFKEFCNLYTRRPCCQCGNMLSEWPAAHYACTTEFFLY